METYGIDKLVEAIHLQNMEVTKISFGEYFFYQIRFIGSTGCILSFPFFSNGYKFLGYLIYSNKELNGFNEEQIYLMGCQVNTFHKSLSGIVGGMSPLPYKPIEPDCIERALAELISKNTKVTLNTELFL